MGTRFGRVPADGGRLDRLSLELTQRCGKACSFCYNGSQPNAGTTWSADEVVAFVTDCARHGLQAVSFGGGEPLEYEGLFEVLARLDTLLFRSLTTNGLLLDGHLDALVAARPDKVHVSLHYPDREREVDRVVRQVHLLAQRGLRSGVNLLVRQTGLQAAQAASLRLVTSGIGVDRIVYLPMRGEDTPGPRELADVAGTTHFQSMSCLLGCAASPRFASVGWDKRVAWCSYTRSRRGLETLDHAGLMAALEGLDLATC